MATADEWIAAYRAAKRANDRLDAITAQLMPTMAVGQVLEGKTAKVRKCDRAILVPDRLRAEVSTALWTNITERKPVAALYKAAMQRGTLDPGVFEASCDRSKPWLEIR